MRSTFGRRRSNALVSGSPWAARAASIRNLTMRMGMRRFTRLTNAFSKKVENHAAAVSLHFMFYNFARPHHTLTKAARRPTTPAMAAGVARYLWSVTQIAALLD